MTQFANKGLLYERYYYYDIAAGRYFDFKDKEDEKKAPTLFKKQHTLLFSPLQNLLTDNDEDVNTTITLQTIYPGLATGIGNAHETGSKGESKLGFFFDYTTGLPVIPGSAVKGVLRSAFPQWETHTNTDDEIKWVKTRYIYGLLHQIAFEATEHIALETMQPAVSAIEAAIFEGKVNGQTLPIYQRDIFYDAIIKKASTYQTTDGMVLGIDAITPHGDDPLKDPKPLPFIKILPGVVLQFNFNLGDAGINKAQKEALFSHILKDRGIGAKTNTGYGQLKDPA